MYRFIRSNATTLLKKYPFGLGIHQRSLYIYKAISTLVGYASYLSHMNRFPGNKSLIFDCINHHF